MARLEDIAVEFWDSTETYGVLPPLTDDLVAETETELGVKLPNELLVLLRRQNGGGVARSRNRFPCAANYWAEDHVPFRGMFGVGPPGYLAGATTLRDTTYLVEEWGLPTPVVLLYGDGHYWIALDYRVSGRHGEPAVTWIDNEMEHELGLAPTFRAFVEGLASSPEPDTTPRNGSTPNEPYSSEVQQRSRRPAS